MISKSQIEQFSLSPDGHILWQEKVGSPLPGKPVAKLLKGESALEPGLDVTIQIPDPDLKGALENWLKGHIATVLEQLVALQNLDAMEEPEKSIAQRMRVAMGVLPREDLEDLIKDLDADKRRILRSSGIRLGPILAFMPNLNKPAAVKLKALLWSLYNDKKLPAPVPNDGIVSFAAPENADKELFQTIGYPIYGPRSIRIDMLDRVVNAIYEAADKGKFQAQHQMAEWLGANIDDLYAILEAMGHVRDRVLEDKKLEGEKVEEASEPSAETPEQPQKKPDLDWFYLKRGKAFDLNPKKPEGKKDFKKPKPEFKKKKPAKPKRGPKPKLQLSAEPEKRPEDSPFAILQQFKKDG